MTFINNKANESGGGIFVEFPPIRFVIDVFNRLCFIQYNDGTRQDVPPQDWVVSLIAIIILITYVVRMLPLVSMTTLLG